MHPFAYFEPKTLDETIALLAGHDGAADLLAGGTDLLVEIKEHIRKPAAVVNLKRVPGLDDLACDAATGLRIGALVTVREVETSPDVLKLYPALAHAASQIGSIQIRNRATVTGNVCRASPSADTLPPLMAYGATIETVGPRGARRIAMEEFFNGPGKTVLQTGEIVTAITCPPPGERAASHYIKLGRRKAMELATVGVAVAITRQGDVCSGARIVLGAVAPTPIRARDAEAVIAGRTLDAAALEQAGRAAMTESRPIGNVRASAAYRRAMVGVLTRQALCEAWGHT